jgi:hypothetical protein
MKLLVAAGAAATAVALVGCGAATPVAHGGPEVAGKPTWGHCHSRVSQIADYGPDARGSASRAAALAPYRQQGDHVVLRPARRAHVPPEWLLVDDQNHIHASVELFHSSGGWLVSALEKCAD